MSATASSTHSPDASNASVVLTNPHQHEEASATEMQNIEPEFCFFPKLPIELRLKIWRAAFPPSRHIRLNSYDGGFCKNINEYSEHGLCPEVLMPITLYINTESRAETLKHYYVFQRRLDKTYFERTKAGPTPPSEGKDRYNVEEWFIYSPLCINPLSDTIYVELTFDRNTRNNTVGLEVWVLEAFQKSPTFFNAVKKLEVRVFSLNTWFSYNKIKLMHRQAATGVIRLFEYFRRLQEIYFISAEDVYFDDWNQEVEQDFRIAITMYFESGMEEDPECLVPKVEIIHPEYGATYMSEYGSEFGNSDDSQSDEDQEDEYGEDDEDDQDGEGIQSDGSSQNDALREEL